MMWRWWPISRPRKSCLESTICGRELSGLILEDDNQTVRLRFSNNSAVVVNLSTRQVEEKSALDYKEWLMLPGWVRIASVIEDANQVILVVSGATLAPHASAGVYMSRISIRFSNQRWQIFFSGGRIL